MKVLLDTNVVLDVLLPRGQWLAEAEGIWQANLDGHLLGYVTASSLTDIYYITRRLTSSATARQVVRLCLDSLEVLTVDRGSLEAAYAIADTDFEDSLQVVSAARHGLDAIVTRDPAGFANAPINILSPGELIGRLGKRA